MVLFLYFLYSDLHVKRQTNASTVLVCCTYAIFVVTKWNMDQNEWKQNLKHNIDPNHQCNCHFVTIEHWEINNSWDFGWDDHCKYANEKCT